MQKMDRPIMIEAMEKDGGHSDGLVKWGYSERKIETWLLTFINMPSELR
jgi:hypothetical protein